MKPYMPGSHLIATLESSQTALLNRHASFRETLSGLITTLNLQQLGEVYHDFDPQGFTGVVCLSESHISIHTWPEYHKINLDIYLSNYLRSNDNTVDKLFDEIVAFFNARVETVQKIIR